jgi:hypothetical protein
MLKLLGSARHGPGTLINASAGIVANSPVVAVDRDVNRVGAKKHFQPHVAPQL